MVLRSLRYTGTQLNRRRIMSTRPDAPGPMMRRGPRPVLLHHGPREDEVGRLTASRRHRSSADWPKSSDEAVRILFLESAAQSAEA